MKKTLAFAILTLTMFGALAAPAQAYYPYNNDHHYYGNRFERDRYHAWPQNNWMPYRDNRMQYQNYERHEWRLEHPFLSIFS